MSSKQGSSQSKSSSSSQKTDSRISRIENSGGPVQHEYLRGRYNAGSMAEYMSIITRYG